MPQPLQDLSLFDKRERVERPKESLPKLGRVKLEPVDWHDDVPEGVKQLIAVGDHMATILGRVLAGQMTPKLTINNVLDEWDNISVGFEVESTQDKNIREGNT